MPRAERLLALMQLLRQQRQAVGGARLAADLGISLRTLYRDIATLQAQGADIEGAPGIGYVLRPGFVLPPLMFSVDEVEALALGSRWVARHTDGELAAAARSALAKISAVLPPPLRHELDSAALLVGPDAAAGDTTGAKTSATTGAATGAKTGVQPGAPAALLADIRRAIRSEHTLVIGYADAQREATQRTVWPFALGFFEQVRVVVAWCELRQGIRHFRTDRITALAWGASRYPRRRQVLLAEWRAAQGIPAA